MNNLMDNKEWYDGLDEEVVNELVTKYEQDSRAEGLLANEQDDSDLTEPEVDEVTELQTKHAINHKMSKHIKRKKQRELTNIGVEGYEDNPDKYFYKKTKKTKAIRQSDKELRHKRERQKELKLKQIV